MTSITSVDVEYAIEIVPIPTPRLSATRARNTPCDICCALMPNIRLPLTSTITQA